MSLFDLFINFFESFSICLFIYLILHTKKDFRMLCFFTILSTLNTTVHNYYNLPEIFLTISSLIIFFIYGNILNKRGYIQNLFLAIFSYLIITLTANFLYTLFYILGFEIPFTNKLYIFFVLLNKIINIILFYLSFMFINKYNFLNSKKLYYLLIILILLCFINNIMIDLIFYKNIINLDIFLIICLISFLLIFNVLLFFETKKEQENLLIIQKEVLKLENEINIYEINKSSIMELKRWKHDMKHIFNNIKYNLDHEDYNKIYDLILENNEIFNENRFIVQSGFDLLDYILIQKYEIMKKNNIESIISYIPCHCPLEDKHFFVIMGNLLDNAIENCESSYLKQIKLDIFQYNDYFAIKIQNTIIHSVLKDNSHLQTTKIDKNNHGFGLKNVNLLLNRYNSFIDFSEENNFFVVKVLIPIDAQFKEFENYY